MLLARIHDVLLLLCPRCGLPLSPLRTAVASVSRLAGGHAEALGADKDVHGRGEKAPTLLPFIRLPAKLSIFKVFPHEDKTGQGRRKGPLNCLFRRIQMTIDSKMKPGKVSAIVALCCQHKSKYYDFEKLKQAVRRAVEKADEQEERFHIRFVPLDESSSSGNINVQIEETIKKASFVIVDLSDVNVNAVYELGLAQGMSTTVLTLREDSSDVDLPFDLSPLRHFEYDGNRLGKLENLLEGKLVDLMADLDVEDLIPKDQVEQILANHLRVVEETSDFTESLHRLLDGCRKNFYYVGSAGLALSDGNWVQLCRSKLKNISAHRVVNLRTLKQVYAETREAADVEEYCVWLGRYYALVKDGIFSLYSSPEVGSRRKGMSFLVFDEESVLISMGRAGSGFNHKAIELHHDSAGRISRQWVMNLAITSREITAGSMGRYFSLASPSREVPTSIVENASGDPGELRKACVDYVSAQLEEMELDD